VVATPGRLVDMFGRKHTAFDLSACVKALVIFYMMILKKNAMIAQQRLLFFIMGTVIC